MEESPRSRRLAVRMGICELLRLYRLMKNIKSYNRTLVEASLDHIVARLTCPGKAVILMRMGVCDALIPLLTLKSSKKQVLIARSLNMLTVLSLTGSFFLDVAANPLFCSLMHDFLKSKPTEQKLAGKIICNMFKQQPDVEHVLINNEDSLQLLVMTLRIPFMSSVIMALRIFEELTYHGANVEAILSRFGVTHELCFMGTLEDYAMSDQEDIQITSLHIILNCLSFVDQPVVRAAVLHHSLHIEGMLVPLFQDDLVLLNQLSKGTVVRKQPRKSSVSRTTYRLGSAISSRPLSTLGRDMHPDIPFPRRVPIAMKVMAVSKRHQVNLEILWILCRLHGKVRGSNRSNTSKRSMALHPEDTYDIFGDLMSGDI